MMRGSGLGVSRSGSGLDTGDLERDFDSRGDRERGLLGDCTFMGDLERELGRGGERARGGVVGRSCFICTREPCAEESGGR